MWPRGCQGKCLGQANSRSRTFNHSSQPSSCPALVMVETELAMGMGMRVREGNLRRSVLEKVWFIGRQRRRLSSTQSRTRTADQLLVCSTRQNCDLRMNADTQPTGTVCTHTILKYLTSHSYKSASCRQVWRLLTLSLTLPHTFFMPRYFASASSRSACLLSYCLKLSRTASRTPSIHVLCSLSLKKSIWEYGQEKAHGEGGGEHKQMNKTGHPSGYSAACWAHMDKQKGRRQEGLRLEGRRQEWLRLTIDRGTLQPVVEENHTCKCGQAGGHDK